MLYGPRVVPAYCWTRVSFSVMLPLLQVKGGVTDCTYGPLMRSTLSRECGICTGPEQLQEGEPRPPSATHALPGPQPPPSRTSRDNCSHGYRLAWGGAPNCPLPL